jgi:hypothetical protein
MSLESRRAQLHVRINQDTKTWLAIQSSLEGLEQGELVERVLLDYKAKVEGNAEERESKTLFDAKIKLTEQLKRITDDSDENVIEEECLGILQDHPQYSALKGAGKASVIQRIGNEIEEDLEKGNCPLEIYKWLDEREPTLQGKISLVLKTCQRLIKWCETTRKLEDVRTQLRALNISTNELPENNIAPTQSTAAPELAVTV